MLLALVLGLALIMGLYGDRSLLGPIGVVLALWIIISALVDPVDRLRRGLSLAPAVLGMTMAHVGLGVITLGITTMETRMVERDVALAPGQDVSIGDYAFRFDGVEDARRPELRRAAGPRGRHPRGRRPEAVLLPERRNYSVQQQTLAEAALGVSLAARSAGHAG